MARIDNLTNFLTDVATAIRNKKGTEEQIPAANFDTEIKSIETGIDTSSDNPITASDVVIGKEGYVNGEKVVGTLPDLSNNGIMTSNSIVTAADPWLKFEGHIIDGDMKINNNTNISAEATYSSVADAIELTPEKLVKGNTVLGVEGTAEAGGTTINNQDKTITSNGQYTADEGYTGLGTVDVQVLQNYISYNTEDEMKSDEGSSDLSKGQRAIVYGPNDIALENNTLFDYIKKLNTSFSMNTAVTSSRSITTVNADYNNNYYELYFYVSSSYAFIQIQKDYGMTSRNIARYETEDGIHYTAVTEHGSSTYSYENIQLDDKCIYNEDRKTDENSDLFNILKSLLANIAITKFKGLYQYNGSKYVAMQNQFTLSNPDNIIGEYSAFGKNGEIVSKDTWENVMTLDKWYKLLNTNANDRKLSLAYNFNAITSKNKVSAIDIRYTKHNDLIQEYNHNRQSNVQYGYTSEVKTLLKIDLSNIEGIDAIREDMNSSSTNDASYKNGNIVTFASLSTKPLFVLLVKFDEMSGEVQYSKLYFKEVKNWYNGSGLMRDTQNKNLVFCYSWYLKDNTWNIAWADLEQCTSGIFTYSVPTSMIPENYSSFNLSNIHFDGTPSADTLRANLNVTYKSGSNEYMNVYSLTNTEATLTYTSPTAYDVSAIETDGNVRIWYRRASSSSTKYTYGILEPESLIKDVYSTSDAFIDGKDRIIYQITNGGDWYYVSDDGIETSFDYNELYPTIVDGVKYKYNSTAGSHQSTSSSYNGKMIKLDGTEVEIGVPRSSEYTIYDYTSINDYQYTTPIEYISDSSYPEYHPYLLVQQDLYSAVTARYYDNTFVPSGIFALLNNSALNGIAYCITDSTLKIQNSYDGTITPDEYNTALTTTEQILGEEETINE